MNQADTREQYSRALRMGKAEAKERLLNGQDPNPAVLDELISDALAESSQYIGTVDIPAERIVGTKTAGRITAFTAGFLPLLEVKSEFAQKWMALCAAHLSETGIRDPITCYEYLGNFYVQEGNKRVSVLKYYGAPRIPGVVYRIVPPLSDDPQIKAYYEFLDFYKVSKLYDVQFTHPGQYAKLTAAIGIAPGQVWTEEDRRRFRAYFQYFKEAFYALGGSGLYSHPEDALLLWLELYTYADLGKMSAGELRASLQSMWDNVIAMDLPTPVVSTEVPTEEKTGLLSRIIRKDTLNVAFVHQRTVQSSPWTMAHDAGRQHLEETLGKKVCVRSYFGADTPELADELMEQAAQAGADVIFATTPQLIASCLRISVQYPKIKVLNCSVHMPYSTVRTYYSRVYEGKFITGAIAGAMAKNDRIGYVGSYPIHGVPAAINAFALGAQMTNPNAVIELRWSCLPGDPTAEFQREGIFVISNRDTPVEDRLLTDSGTYMIQHDGTMTPLGSPTWMWGRFYENVIRSMLSGAWDTEKGGKIVNYWWGMSSGVVDIKLGDALPEGVRYLANMLRSGLRQGLIDPFRRRIVTQDGTVINDGSRTLSPDDLLHMDWLCQNVRGSIPRYEEVLPISRPMVKLLGVFPPENPEEVQP